LRTGDGVYQLAPNSTLWNTPVKNFSRLPTRGFSVSFVLPLATDIGKAEVALKEIVARDRRVAQNPASSVSISDVTPDTLTLKLGGWAKTADAGAVTQDIAKAAKAALDAAKLKPLDDSATRDAAPMASVPAD
jgi:small conductance mechanosensitive channel